MSTTSSLLSSTSSTSSSSSSTTSDAYDSLTTEDFLNLLVTELQNQDPMDPVDNSEILQEVSQIKAIDANEQLSDSLTSMQLAQNLVTAGNLLQKTVSGLTDDGESVSGQVDSVTVSDDKIIVNVGDQSITSTNITSVQETE
jgi:flagellar basal-body rod modification protein FlgD